MAGHVERDGVGVPGRAQVADRLAVDDQRRELILRRWRGWRRCRWRQQEIGVGEQPLDRAEHDGAVEQGLAQHRDVDRRAFLERLCEGGIEIVAPGFEQVGETGDLVGAQDQARHVELPVDVAAIDLLHARALALEEVERLVEARLGVGMEVAAGHPADHGEALAGDRVVSRRRRPGERGLADGEAPRVLGVAARHRGEAGAEILGMARHDTEIGELAELVGRQLVRHTAQRRLQPVDAAAGGGNAARARAVGRHGDRPQA